MMLKLFEYKIDAFSRLCIKECLREVILKEVKVKLKNT